MLTITLNESEGFNSKENCFVKNDKVVLTLSHTLVSVSKWETKWLKPFLSEVKKTDEETADYIRCMSLSDLDQSVLNRITNVELNMIKEYIENPMTATTVTNRDGKKGRAEIVTTELIYYWMIALNIPWECQHWHLNRLMMLINVCNIKNTPSKKMSKKETLTNNAALNAARKKAMNTPG